MGQQERYSPNLFCFALPAVAVWTGSAFCAALGLAALVLEALRSGGPRHHRGRSRCSGRPIPPVRSRLYSDQLSSPLNGADVNLAFFASAHLVRLGFVARLSYIGAASALVYFSFSELPHCGLTLLLCSRFLVCKGAGVKGLSKGWWVLASALPRFF